jgi:uncharacterized repeat protein (TIGR01451 family)
MKRLIDRFLMISIILISLSTFAHAANPTFYTDRAAFQAGLGSLLTDDYSPASGYGSGFNVYSNAVMSAFFGETDYVPTAHLNQNMISSEIYCSGCNGSFRLIFTSTSFTQGGMGIFGAGVDIVRNETPTYYAFITYGDATTESRALPAGSSFFGVTAPELIQSIHFGLSDGSPTASGSFQIDNLTIGNQGSSADLTITKSDDPDPVTAGQTLTYTIIVSNAGPSDATNVVATDILPSGVTLVSTSGCAEDPNGCPDCGLGTIDTGGSKQYSITVTVDPGTTGTLTNNVSVLSDVNDSDTSNNSASEDTVVMGIVPIPTMTEWGIIIFMALASIVAIHNLKKRGNALK